MTENLFKHLFLFQEIFRVNISIMFIHRMVPTMSIHLVKRGLSGADLFLNYEHARMKYWQDCIVFVVFKLIIFESFKGIDEMNIARQAHNTPPLSCSKSLEDQAQAWAQELFDRGIQPDCK